MSRVVQNYTLEQLCELVKGTSPTLKTGPGDYPLVVTAAFRRTSADWQIEGPAVCVPLVSSTGHGDAAIHRVHFQDGKFALANLLVALIPRDPTICDAKFLYYLLQTRKDELLVPLMLGTANVSLKQNDIAAVEVPLPPVDEQRRIVARVEELATKVEVARGLRTMALTEQESLLKARITQRFAELEAAYSRRSFGSCDVHVSSGPRNWGKHYATSGWRFYRAQDIGGDFCISGQNIVFVEPPPGDQGRSAKLKDGDLLIVITGATVGRVAVFDSFLTPGLVSQHVAVCRLPQDVFLSRFALWGLRGADGQAQLLGSKYGQGKPGLNLDQVRNLSLPCPPIDVQERVIAELDALRTEVDAVKALQEETAAKLDAILPAILDKAFKGEL